MILKDYIYRITQTQGIPFESHLIFALGYKLSVLVSHLEFERDPYSPIIGINEVSDPCDHRFTDWQKISDTERESKKFNSSW